MIDVNNSENNSGQPLKAAGSAIGYANLKPFKKGQSGNPKGRPKGSRDYKTLIDEALITIGKTEDMTACEVEVALVQTAITKAMTGNYRFYADIMNRLFGPIPKASKHTSDFDDMI
jgi:hypothetical protein